MFTIIDRLTVVSEYNLDGIFHFIKTTRRGLKNLVELTNEVTNHANKQFLSKGFIHRPNPIKTRCATAVLACVYDLLHLDKIKQIISQPQLQVLFLTCR